MVEEEEVVEEVVEEVGGVEVAAEAEAEAEELAEALKSVVTVQRAVRRRRARCAERAEAGWRDGAVLRPAVWRALEASTALRERRVSL